jgi:hypothetical protein
MPKRSLKWLLFAVVLGAVFWTFPSIAIDYDRGPLHVRHARLMALEGSIYAYVMDLGHLPAALTELTTSNESGWQGPYVRAETLHDTDGADVSYEIIDPKLRKFRLGLPARLRSGSTTLPAIVEEDSAPAPPAAAH